jgi:molecular chaperone DnaK (HSP70)
MSTSSLVIAIDFGTTYTGVAYAYSSGLAQEHPGRLTEEIRVVNSWPNSNSQYVAKIPTVLAYDKTLAWGGAVKPRHGNKITAFKLGLQKSASRHYGVGVSQGGLGGFITDPNWRHPAFPDKTAVDYTADYLTAVRQYVTDSVLPRQFGHDFIRELPISYVLTVPAIWDDTAKDLTRQAATRAGIPPRNLILIPEPEAGALYCATIIDEVDLREGDCFMVCDAGGGTVV